MQRTARVAERLPEFYRSWDPDSVLYGLINAFARSLNEQQRDLFRIPRTHWVETAHLADLDAIGAIFDLLRSPGETDEDYRIRIKNGIQRFKGGGTRESVISMMAAFLKTEGAELELVENPAAPLVVTRSVAGDSEWTLGSMGVEDAPPRMELSVVDEGERIVDPTLTVKETGASVRFRGTVAYGQRLVIEGARATLDEEDVSDSLERKGEPSLLRSGSTWSFHEALSSLVGSFDRSVFDGSVFQKPVPRVRVRFDWTSRQPCAFELVVPRRALERSHSSPEEVEGLLNIIRAQGVRATLRVKE